MLSDFLFDDGAAYHQSTETLVLGDLHLGRTYSRPNQSYPEPEYRSIQRRIENLVDTYSPSSIVFNGDTFDTLPPTDESIELLQQVTTSIENTYVLTGNHDNNSSLLGAALPASLAVAAEHALNDDITILHGHRPPTGEASLYIINHIHPRMDGQRCTLYHRQPTPENAAVLVLPTFSMLSEGPHYEKYTRTGHAPIVAAGKSLSTYSVVATATGGQTKR